MQEETRMDSFTLETPAQQNGMTETECSVALQGNPGYDIHCELCKQMSF